jgi:hypothetical protein
MGWKKPGKMLLAEPPVQDECAHRIRFRPKAMVEVRRGGCSYTLIAGFLGVPASVDLTGVCALGNVGFVIILTLAALVDFLSQSPWERFLLAPTALLLPRCPSSLRLREPTL